jgi:hypothetical protein
MLGDYDNIVKGVRRNFVFNFKKIKNFEIFDKKLFGDNFVTLNSVLNKMFVSSFVELNELYLNKCRYDSVLRSWLKYIRI